MIPRLVLILLIMLYPLSFSQTHASPLDELEEKRKIISIEKSTLSNEVEQIVQDEELLKSTLNSLQQDIDHLNIEIDDTTQQVGVTERVFFEIAEENELLIQSIQLLEKNIGERDKIIKMRMSVLQISGGPIDYIDVLLGANSFIDFIERATSIQTLLEADRQILKQQQSDIAQLDAQKLTLTTNLSEQRTNVVVLSNLKDLLETNKDAKEDETYLAASEKNALTSARNELEIALSQKSQEEFEVEQEIKSLQQRQGLESTSQQIYTNYTTEVTCNADGELNTTQFLSKFENAGVFTGKGQTFIDVAAQYNVDPVLLAAIAFHETGTGTSNAVVHYNNPGGLMNPETNWSTLIRFDSIDDGLRSTGKTLNKLIYKGGLATLSSLGSAYAPLGAENDPLGLNRHWVPNVTKFTNDLGGLFLNCSND